MALLSSLAAVAAGLQRRRLSSFCITAATMGGCGGCVDVARSAVATGMAHVIVPTRRASSA